MQNLQKNYINKFREAAIALVQAEVSDTSDDNKEVIAMFTARDMAVGAKLTKNKYILTGVAIGLAGSVLTLGINTLVEKRKEGKVTEDDILDEIEKLKDIKH